VGESDEAVTEAKVYEVDGQLVLDDPAALGMIRAVGKHNCTKTLELNAERISHFRQRIEERGDSPNDMMIVIINVDDNEMSAGLADALMPGHDWQAYRDRGEVPFAPGS